MIHWRRRNFRCPINTLCRGKVQIELQSHLLAGMFVWGAMAGARQIAVELTPSFFKMFRIVSGRGSLLFLCQPQMVFVYQRKRNSVVTDDAENITVPDMRGDDSDYPGMCEGRPIYTTISAVLNNKPESVKGLGIRYSSYRKLDYRLIRWLGLSPAAATLWNASTLIDNLSSGGECRMSFENFVTQSAILRKTERANLWSMLDGRRD